MITEEEIFKYWGEDLVKISPEQFSHLKIDEATKTFLSTIGLPIKENFLLASFKINLDGLEVLNYKNSQYVVLADNYEVKICLQEETGEIFEIDARGEYPTRFVNSDIKSLIIFMQLFENFHSARFRVPDYEEEGVIQKLRENFLEADAKALSNGETLWMVILEQLSDGLL